LKDVQAVSNGQEIMSFAFPKEMKDWNGLTKLKVIALQSA